MFTDIVGAAMTAALGIGVACLNYFVSKYMLLHSPDKFIYSTVVRTLVVVLLLVGIYFVGDNTPCDVTWLLVGAALGATLPSFFFTSKLLKLNQRLSADKKNENSKEKEDNTNG